MYVFYVFLSFFPIKTVSRDLCHRFSSQRSGSALWSNVRLISSSWCNKNMVLFWVHDFDRLPSGKRGEVLHGLHTNHQLFHFEVSKSTRNSKHSELSNLQLSQQKLKRSFYVFFCTVKAASWCPKFINLLSLGVCFWQTTDCFPSLLFYGILVVNTTKKQFSSSISILILLKLPTLKRTSYTYIIVSKSAALGHGILWIAGCSQPVWTLGSKLNNSHWAFQMKGDKLANPIIGFIKYLATCKPVLCWKVLKNWLKHWSLPKEGVFEVHSK